jgi:hypothetical protein
LGGIFPPLGRRTLSQAVALKRSSEIRRLRDPLIVAV